MADPVLFGSKIALVSSSPVQLIYSHNGFTDKNITAVCVCVWCVGAMMSFPFKQSDSWECGLCVGGPPPSESPMLSRLVR